MKEMILLVFVLLCAWRDVRSFRIPNALILAGAGAAAAVRILTEGSTGGTDMAVGAVLPLLICVLLFRFSMVGAGDVKMLMVIGGFAGGKEILTIMWYSLLAAAVFALIRVRKYHLAYLRAGYFADYIRRFARGEKDMAYISAEEIAFSSRWLMHLAVPIAVGCLVWVVMQHL